MTDRDSDRGPRGTPGDHIGDGSSGDEDAEELSPTDTQRDIIESETYPMRVAAAAGTGKTFTMIRKIERLLTPGVEPEPEGVAPEQVLALTFTNEAAAEIRTRLVDRIGPEAHDIDTHTYHAVGERLLSEHAYDDPVDPRYEVAGEVDQLRLVYDVLDDLPYCFTKPRVPAPGEAGKGLPGKLHGFITRVKSADIEPDDLRAYLGGPETLIELGELPDRLSEAAGEIWDYGWYKPSAERLENEIAPGLDRYREVLEAERATLRDGDSGLEADIAAYLDELLDLCETLGALFGDRAAETLGEAHEELFRLPAWLFEAKYTGHSTTPTRLGDTPLDRLETAIEECQAAWDLTVGYERYERRLEEAHLLDYADLVNRATRVLKDEETATAASTDWAYVFCDEFQDTDRIQFDLVEQLVGEDDLFVVGDDAQAIYEWRGANKANITTRLADAFAPVEETLRENFRSYAPILELADNAQERNPDQAGGEPFEPATDEQETTRGVITVTAPADADGNGTIDDEAQAQQVADSALRLLDGETEHVTDADLQRIVDEDEDPPEGYRPEDIAILVRKHDHAVPIVEALEARGLPYQLSEGLAADSPGVRTVIEFLKAVSNPQRDDSLLRVLRARYRVPEPDLRALNEAGDALIDPLLDADLADGRFREPELLRTAREHFETLLRQRETLSLERFYEEFKRLTNVEWFLPPQDRAGLATLDDLIANYGHGAVDPELSEEFIDFLRFNATTVLEGSGGTEPDLAEDAINVLTAHKSKGLEFPVVLLPNLSADDWRVDRQSHTELRHALSEPDGRLLDPELISRDEYEERRLFHVAVTRAENCCVLYGRSEDEDSDDDLTPAAAAEPLPNQHAWCVENPSFDVWTTVRESLPETAIDGTDTLAAPVEDLTRGVARDGDTALDLEEAERAVLNRADRLLNRGLAPTDPATFGVAQSFPGETSPRALRKHSYTALERFEECPRKHYLQNVVHAFDDPDPSLLLPGHDYPPDPSAAADGDGTTPGQADAGSTTPTMAGVDARTVGTLFHDAADRVGARSAGSPEAWRAAWRDTVGKLATSRRCSDRVEQAALECVDVFFETRARDWTVLSTERSFEVEYDDQTIRGQIDAVCETTDGELVVVDYKTTRERKPTEKSRQLPLYLYAASQEGMLGREVHAAVYIYVNPELDIADRVVRHENRPGWVDERMIDIGNALARLDENEWESGRFDAGRQCLDCTHASLSCSEHASLDPTGNQE